MIITPTKKGYEIRFDFDYAKMYALKSIPGAWFHSRHRCWYVGAQHEEQVKKLIARFRAHVVQPHADIDDQLGASDPLPELEIELNLPRTLFEFQKQGVAYNRIHKKVLIADAPGLGKTSQAIATVISLGLKPGLTICPNTAKLNWQKEWMDVAGVRSMILSDNVKNTWYRYYEAGFIDHFIVNAESIRSFFITSGWKKPKRYKSSDIPLKDVAGKFKYLIVDESHKFRNPDADWTKNVLSMARGKEYVFCFSGTPLVNKPRDLFPQLAILGQLQNIVSHIPQPRDEHGKLMDGSGRDRFLDRYCEGGHGAEHLRELNYRLRKFCFYRREKRDVLKDLPAKMRQVILCEISTRQEYTQAEEDFKKLLKEAKTTEDPVLKKKLRGIALVRIGQLKEISARGKLETAYERIEEITSAAKKIIVFANLKAIIRSIKEQFPDAVTVTGDDSISERDAAVRAFQNDPAFNIILCSLGTGAEAINLTAASDVLFVEFPWNEAKCIQCEDRADRIGQTEMVTAAYLLGEKTIDKWCYEINQKKKDMLMEVNGDVNEVNEEVIDQLYNLFNQ